MLLLAPRSIIPIFPSVGVFSLFWLPAVIAELSPRIFFAFDKISFKSLVSTSIPSANILEPLSLRYFVIFLTSNPPLYGISYSFNHDVIDFSDLHEDGEFVKEFPMAASIFGLLDSKSFFDIP